MLVVCEGYYERIGLLPEPDRLHGQRRYGADMLGKLGFIGVAQSAGFKLREIKELDEVEALLASPRPASSIRTPSSPCRWSGSRARTVVAVPRTDCGCERLGAARPTRAIVHRGDGPRHVHVQRRERLRLHRSAPP